ncbi:MAG: metal ABC transporter substrate-binding protein, partial [Proteobacteria bacterium]|nr:metal ABC transporter substrate-binding protein [Pseudomonadota bacterium]
PTPLEIKRIVENIKIHGVKAVFAEPQFNPKVAEVIAREAGIKVLMLDPMGGPGIKERESYIDIMKYNLKVLREAML